MFAIVHTQSCAQMASALAKKLSDKLSDTLDEVRFVPVEEALSDPDALGDFDKIGLVFHNDGKSLPLEMQDFIREVLGNSDLRGLEYMFSLCMCDNPGHALKIVEKLCAKAGCAPSLSLSLKTDASEKDIEEVASLVESGNIRLAKGSIGTWLYMLFHGIKTTSAGKVPALRS